MAVDMDYLFAPEILDIDLDQNCDAKFNPKLSIADPGEGLVVRPLAKQDYEKGFLQVFTFKFTFFVFDFDFLLKLHLIQGARD